MVGLTLIFLYLWAILSKSLPPEFAFWAQLWLHESLSQVWKWLREFLSRNWKLIAFMAAYLAFVVWVTLYAPIGGKAFWSTLQDKELTLDGWRNLALIVAAAVGFPFLVWRSFIAQSQVKAAQDQVNVAETGQDFDRYQKGADMLGHPRLSVRQAGIFALKELALRNPEAYLDLVQQVLCSFIRDRSEEDREAAKAQGAKTSPEDDEVETPDSSIASDNQTALDTLAKDFASLRKNRNTARLDLNHAHLRGAHMDNANLSDANLSDANLSDANLSRADLRNANLSRAYLRDANLEHAYLNGANLNNAILVVANLSDADLVGANLSDAYLGGANLSRANLSYANLSDTDLKTVRSLTQEQLDGAWAWSDSPPELNEGLKLKSERLFDPALRADYEESGRIGRPDQDFLRSSR